MDVHYVVKKEMSRRKYSNRTIKTYLFCLDKFFNQCNKEISKISKSDVREYLNELNKENTAGNTINVHLNALKFFFEEILNKRMRLNIKYSKVPKRIPVVLTKNEVKILFDSISNEKHKLMIQLMYSAGLRVSEVINLKIQDLNLENNYGYIRKSKGNKDRMFIIAENLKDNIKDLIKKEDFSDYLFINNRKKIYTSRTLQEVIKKAVKKSKINKTVSCHTLRHSFATHLIEDGYSISEVQALLGHKSPETTFIYVHSASPNMIKVKSPLDTL